jgi:hypothetical protein
LAGDRAVRVRVIPLPRALGPALIILYIATAVGCDAGKRPYDTPASGVEGDQAVRLLRREAEWRAVKGTFPKAEKVETQTPSGVDAWLVRLVSEDGSRDLCGYVWRGEEGGRADATKLFIRFDDGCRHWPE